MYEYPDIEEELARSEAIINSHPPLLFKYKSIDDSAHDESKEDDAKDKNKDNGENKRKNFCHTIEIFEEFKLFMPTHDKLNDPVEGVYSYVDIQKNTYRRVERTDRVISFSENAFAHTLWGNYADNGRGICIGFKTFPTFYDVMKVEYSTRARSFFGDIGNGVNLPCAAQKHPDWSSEMEWRIVEDTKNTHRSIQPEDIVCVLLGSKLSDEGEVEIIKYVPKHAKIFKLEVVPEKPMYRAYNIHDHNEIVHTTQELIKLVMPNG